MSSGCSSSGGPVGSGQWQPRVSQCSSIQDALVAHSGSGRGCLMPCKPSCSHAKEFQFIPVPIYVIPISAAWAVASVSSSTSQVQSGQRDGRSRISCFPKVLTSSLANRVWQCPQSRLRKYPRCLGTWKKSHSLERQEVEWSSDMWK